MPCIYASVDLDGQVGMLKCEYTEGDLAVAWRTCRTTGTIFAISSSLKPINFEPNLPLPSLLKNRTHWLQQVKSSVLKENSSNYLCDSTADVVGRKISLKKQNVLRTLEFFKTWKNALFLMSNDLNRSVEGHSPKTWLKNRAQPDVSLFLENIVC